LTFIISRAEISDQEMLPAPASERYFDSKFLMQVQSTHSSRSRKRSASLQSASDEEKNIHSDTPVKRLKRYPATAATVTGRATK
jgi:hypothetical protein